MSMINAEEPSSIMAFALHDGGSFFLRLFLSKTDRQWSVWWIGFGQEKINNTNVTVYYIEISDCEFDEAIILTPTAFPFTFQFFHHEKKTERKSIHK